MAIAYVSATSVANATRTSTVVNMPAGVATDHEVRIFVSAGLASLTATTITPPGSVTYVSTVTYGASDPWTLRVSEYRYRVVGAGDPASFTFTTASASTEAIALAFSGVDPTTPDDATSTTSTGTGNAGTFGSASVVTNASALVGIRGSWDGNAISPPASWVEVVDQAVNWVGYRLGTPIGSTGSIAVDSGNPSGILPWGSIMSVLRPAPVAPTGSITYVTKSGLVASISGTTSGSSSLRWGDGSLYGTAAVDPTTTSGQQPLGQTGRTLFASEEFTGPTVSVTNPDLGLVNFRSHGPTWKAWYPEPLAANPHTNNPGTEKEWYDQSAISLDGTSSLVLTATRDHIHDAVSLPYTSGMIVSNPSLNLSSGYFEARIKCSGTSGAWPAFWLIPASYTWPPEIDIMDCPSGADSGIYKISNFTSGATVYMQSVSNDMTQWHTYGLDFSPTVLKWYLDGTLIATETNLASIPHEPLYVVANLAVLNTAVLTHSMNVDYIRMWSSEISPTASAWQSIILPISHTYAAPGTYTVGLASDGTQVDTTSLTVTSYPARSTWYSGLSPKPTAALLSSIQTTNAHAIAQDLLLGTVVVLGAGIIVTYWDGSAWQTTTKTYWDGANWQSELRSYWTGTNWT